MFDSIVESAFVCLLFVTRAAYCIRGYALSESPSNLSLSELKQLAAVMFVCQA